MGEKQDISERLEERDERLFFASRTVLPETIEPDIEKPKGDRADTPLKPAKQKRKNIDFVSTFERLIRAEGDHGTAFLFIPVFMIGGVGTYFALPSEPALHNIPITFALLLVTRWLAANGRTEFKYGLNAALIFVAAMGLSQWRTHMLDTKMLGSEVSTQVLGKIRAIETRANGSVRYTFDIISTERPTLRYAPERVRATARKPLIDAEIGGGIAGYVRLRPPSGPVRPHGYDFAFHNYFGGIGANGFFLGAPRVTALPAAYQGLLLRDKIEKGRLWLANHIAATRKNQQTAVSAALITGQKAAISDDINEALRISGLAHILSISGLHMALVAGTVMFALRAIFATMPNWAARHPTKKYAAIIALCAISIYLFLAGASVATQRSFVMLAVMIGALMADRSALTMRNLAIAAIIIIFIAPETVLGPSFQMSFAATLALIAAYAAWTRWRSAKLARTEIPNRNLSHQIAHKSASFIGGLSMTSIVAGTATGLFAAYHFQRIAVLGLLGNLLAMPIVSMVTMPAAILATLLIPIGLDGYVYAVMHWSVDKVLYIAQYVAEIAPDGGTGALAPAAIVWATIGMLLLCLLHSRLRLVGLLCLLPAYWAQANIQIPYLVISEGAKQVAVIDNDETFYVNRSRPNVFILKQWQSAYSAKNIIKPNSVDKAFQCEDKSICRFDDPENDMLISYLLKPPSNADDWHRLCKQSSVIIEAYAPSEFICDESDKAIFITAQQLSLYGSAEVYLSADSPKRTYVKHAQGNAKRPWQSHRKFSRPARNLGPIKRN